MKNREEFEKWLKNTGFPKEEAENYQIIGLRKTTMYDVQEEAWQACEEFYDDKMMKLEEENKDLRNFILDKYGL